MEDFRLIITRPALQALEVYADDNSYCRKEVMAENQLYLNLSLPQYEDIPVGSTVLYSGELYTLSVAPKIKKNNNNHYDYQLTLSASYADLGKYIVYNTIDNRLKFDYTAKAHEHLQLVVDNLNNRGGGWTMGECLEADEKLISYNLSTCMDALQAITEVFETEWEIVGKTINLRKVEYNKDAPLELSYGRGKGLCAGIERMSYNDEKPIGRLFIQGGERNIFLSTYGAKELHLPKDKTITYDGIEYKVSADGQYIERASGAINGGNEGVLDLTHIYPSHTCEIESVAFLYSNNSYASIYDLTSAHPELNKEDSSDWDKVQVNVKVKSEANNPDYSQDSIQVAGETMRAVFQSGMLGGREFDIHKYVHDTLTFELTSEYVDGYRMPAGYSYHPSAGDKFIVVGINLPSEYVTEAENKALEEAVKYLNEHESVKVTISANIDQIAAARKWDEWADKIRIGGYVRLSDDDLLSKSEDIRIKAVKFYLNSRKRPHIEMSNSIGGISLSAQIKQIESQEVHANELHKSSLQFTRRKYADAQETARLLESAFEDYAQAQKVISLETMQMVVGNEALQFAFTEGLTDNVIQPNIVYNSADNTLSVSAISIKHYTLGITSIMPSNYSGDVEYKRWSVKAFLSEPLDEKKPYFLYIKAPKESLGAEFVVSDTAIKMDAENGFYHFLVGILNSENEGERGFAPLYGYTEILPSQVRTDAIVSADGKTKLDLLLGILSLNDYSGVSGHIESALGDKSIAAWFGGQMVDKELNPNALNAARAIFRQDGTGYLAGGNITWNDKGAGSVAGGALAWDEKGSVLRGSTKIEGLTSLDNLVDNVTFNEYKTQTNDTLTKYSTRITTTESKIGEVKTALGDYAKTSDLANYAKVTDLTEGLATKLNKTEFESWKIDYEGLYATKLDLKDVSDRVAVFEEWFKLENGYIKATRGFFSDGTMGARAVGSTGGGGGGLIAYVYGYDAIEGTYYDTDKNNTFNAYTIARLHSRLKGVEDAGYITSSALNGYAKTTDLANYATTSALTSGLANKQDTITSSNKLPYSYLSGVPDLSVYATTTSLNSGLANKVDKVSGKGLSTNDFTTALLNKLNGIAESAEVNVQSDWDATSGDAFIKNKPNLSLYALNSTLASVAFSGSYADLDGTPQFGDVATSNDYNDLYNTPQSLKNPYALTFGSKTYDGSSAKTITASDLGALTSHQAIYGLTIKRNGTLLGVYTPNSASKEIDIAVPTKMSELTDDVVSGKYLPLSGGVLQADSADMLVINRLSSTSSAYITFKGNNSLRGRIGFDASNNPIVQDINYGTGNHTLIHSGNIAAQLDSRYFRANYGSLPTDKDLATLPVGSYWVYENTGLSNKAPITYSSLVVLGKSYYAPQLSVIHNASRAWLRGLYNGESSSTASEWHELAFLDSNVASATKLHTPRTIWGQSFDGTGNVDGKIYQDGKWILGRHSDGNLYIGFDTYSTNDTLIYGRSLYFGTSAGHSMLINSSGNVGIGTDNPQNKLDVDGNAHFTGLITADSGIKIGDATITWDASANALKIDKSVYSLGGFGTK